MTRKRPRHRKGSLYERVVSDIVKALDTDAEISQGEWVSGPDGYRELDVRITGVIEGHERRLLIECKDYDPKSTGPVGIGHVDALDSKSRDLGFHDAAICSNAGFTEGAVKKATRLGIGLIGVFKKGDKRIKYSISEEIYTRQIHVEHLNIRLGGVSPKHPDHLSFEDIIYQGIPLGNWVIPRFINILAVNLIVNGSLSDNFHLIKPVEFALPSGVLTANSFGYQVEFRGNWHAQFVKFDGTGGLYNWLRYKFIVVPGQSQVTIADFDPMGGDIIPQPPDRYLRFVKELQLGEMNLQFLVLTGLRDPGDQIADLNDRIVSGDLDPILDNIESRMLISSSA